MITMTLKNFQQRAVDDLLTVTHSGITHKNIIVQAPTGSGKTIIMIDFIDQYLQYNPNTCFVWFCPGKGELEIQSLNKMKQISQRDTGDLQDILMNGFQAQYTYFINWEKVTKTGNRAITETERGNLFDKIKQAHSEKLQIILIIDEEHSNNTAKAKNIIQTINADREIRVSATPSEKHAPKTTYITIDEKDVINEELITRSIFLNKGLSIEQFIEGQQIAKETALLLNKANEVRQILVSAYEEEGENINPLVLVQFPSNSDALQAQVEKHLETLGFTYENERLACWFSGNRENDENLSVHDGKPCFLLFKQAIATGWDCPRAKILVTLRENMSETFEIQTIGRLRRMPKAKHYDNDVLNHSYIYTFDENFHQEVLKAGGMETQRVFLKKEAKGINLIKQVRDRDVSFADQQSIRAALHQYFKETFHLSTQLQKNRRYFERENFILGTVLNRHFSQGQLVKTTDLAEDDLLQKNYYSVEVNLTDPSHNNYIRQTLDKLKTEIGISLQEFRRVLEHLFLKDGNEQRFKLLDLNKREFAAFILNNQQLLKEHLRNYNSQKMGQLSLNYQGGDYIKEINFSLPREENYRIASLEEGGLFGCETLESNVYEKYNTLMIAGKLRSQSEKLFENFCEQHSRVKFVYKNGDKGMEYYSINYQTPNFKYHNFYPDYIVQLDNDEIIIIETKGGETASGDDKNIDRQVENKFEAIKVFAKAKGYHFAFVRDKENKLFYSQTHYVHRLTEQDAEGNYYWQPLEQLFNQL